MIGCDRKPTGDLEEKSKHFDKLYREHKELENEYERQRERLKEARSELKEKTGALVEQEKILQETKDPMNREHGRSIARLIDERHQQIEQAKAVPDKVQTTLSHYYARAWRTRRDNRGLGPRNR